MWVVMFAAHAHWLFRSFGSDSSWFGSKLATAAAVVFFALKAVDYAPIRVPLNRQSLVVCVMVVLLLHSGVIGRSVGHDVTLTLWTLPAFIATALALKPVAVSFIRHLLRVAAVIGQVPMCWSRTYWHRRARTLLCAHQYFLTALGVPRAPPA